jgi:DNA-3-methyladenine glycosylase I
MFRSLFVSLLVHHSYTNMSRATKRIKNNHLSSSSTSTSLESTQLEETLVRCDWVGSGRPHMEAYHDNEWGVPVHDDKVHFEFLILEGAQAGLSWDIILKKRMGYAAAFKNFNAADVSQMTDSELEALRQDTSIIRNKLKIYSARINARVFTAIQEEFGSFDSYVWKFVKGRQQLNSWKSMAEIPTSTKESDELSKDLKDRGMKFVGTTIIYSYMQAVGLVNDHLIHCCKRLK